MKIKTFAGGGIVYLPTTDVYEEAANTAASSSSSGTSSSKSNVPGFASKIIDMVKENGIDVDVTSFLNQVQHTLDLASDPTGENLSMREILSLARQANSVRNNYAAYDEAQQSLTKNNTWGELALDSAGRIYVGNNETGNIETISPDTYIHNRNKYTPLTNGDLLDQRRGNTNLAFNNNILDNITKSVGITDIVSNLRDIINNFKTTEVTGYVGKNKTDISSGLSQIIEQSLTGAGISDAIVAGPDGLYKVNQKSTFVDQDVTNALNFLKMSMPTDHRKALDAKAAVEGYTSDAMLLMMLVSNTGRTLNADYEASLSANSGKSSSSGSGGDITGSTQHTLAESYADGENLNFPQMIDITPSGSTSSLVIYGQNAGPIYTDQSGKPGTPMPVANLAQVLQDSHGLRDVMPDQTVVFGDQLISKEELGGLVYTGSNMYRVVLPAKTDPSGRHIIPDFELQQKLDNIVQTAQNKGEDAAAISRLIQQECPGAKYDPQTGGIILPSDRTHVFLTFEAIGANNYIDFNGDSNYLVQSDVNADVYKSAVTYGYANHKDTDNELVSGTAQKRSFSGSLRKHLYQGNVFVPITSPIAGTLKYNQEYIPKSSYTDITERGMETERQAQIRERLANPESTNWNN